MSNRDALAKLIGEALGADESAGCGGGYVDGSSLSSTVLDGRFDLEALAEAVIAAGWQASSAEKTLLTPLGAQQEIARLRMALDEIEDLADPHSEILSIARKALYM